MNFHSLRFDRAASTYASQSRVQERMAATLMGMLADRPGSVSGDTGSASKAPGTILEMGCGTGGLSRMLAERFSNASLLATDAAPRMLAAAHSNLGDTPNAAWALFDASGGTPLPAGVRDAAPFDLAASNALVQWFPDLRTHFSLVRSLLVPSGAYLVSGFSRDNFPELNAILGAPPFSYPDFPGHPGNAIKEAAIAAGFRPETYREDSIEVVLPSARAFLESIRAMGSARRPETGRPMTRSRLRLLLDTYQERYAAAAGVRATWKPWCALLVRDA
jgi:malonyl-CoA O-methyltransferase